MPVPLEIDTQIDNATLIARVTDCARREREARADFIVYLAEFDRRRLYSLAGYPSLFAWLQEHLRLAKASAYRRVTAARLHARMPAVAAYLREGRLSLTKLCLLKDVLAPNNCLALLEQAAALSEKDVEELAAILDTSRAVPQPRDSIRALPCAPSPSPAPSLQHDLFAVHPAAAPAPASTAAMSVAPARASIAAPESASTVPQPARPDRRLAGSVAEPSATVRHVIKMTVGPEFMTLLGQVRAERSHVQPGASLESLFADCMATALATWWKRRRAPTDRPRAARPPGKESRNIPAQVRRAVWRREQGRCTFVSADGHRCTATHRLELHHEHPFALGGDATEANIRIVCAEHNQLMARGDFGAHMEPFMARH
jgi:hypothetical protein